MTVWIVSFSAQGSRTADALAARLEHGGSVCRRFAPKAHCLRPETEALDQPVADWAGAGFSEADALVFVCAAGIAVRAIAPHVVHKTKDPAVVVVDECGRFSIPILSGHLGGANALAERIAALTGALPVVTTATDLNGVFAVDVFAGENDLQIRELPLAKAVSAALLAQKPVGFRSELPVSGPLPPGLTEGDAALGIHVTQDAASAPFPTTLHLVPRRYCAGMGCRRGVPEQALLAFLKEQLAACGVAPEALSCVASVDAKRGEAGLLSLCRTCGVPFRTFSAEELQALPGVFSSSAFVEAAVGVDCVCERAAVLASGGTLVQSKVSRDGMTFALAKKEEGITFETRLCGWHRSRQL